MTKLRSTIHIMTSMTLAISMSSHAQSNGPTSQNLLQFLDKAVSHINLGKEIQRQCPSAKYEIDLHTQLRNGFESSPLILAIFESKLEQTRSQAEPFAAELLEKIGGCSDPKFEKLEMGVSRISGSFLVRWIKQDF